ncbi:hypothetical protein [Mycobacterium leprae]|uniref:hypothetical protein n=1 Tax=Mycobacterium leprae TaxID=1769 RepID=UPI00030320FF|nr:hypothetical protein [Mycobacterium leprae]
MLRDVDEFELTDTTRIAAAAAVRARFGDRAPILVEITLLCGSVLDKLAGLGDISAGCSPTRHFNR